MHLYGDPRVRYFHQSNRGIAALAYTYNRALSLAKGEVIAILEGDDLWPPDKLALMVPLFDDPGVVLAWGEAQDVDGAGKLSRVAPRTYRQRARLPRSILFNDPVGSATPYLLTASGQAMMTTSTVLIRASALARIGGFQDPPGTCPIDIPTFVELSRMGKFHYLPRMVGYRRRHFRSATLQLVHVMPAQAREFALHKLEEIGVTFSAEECRLIVESWRIVPFSAAFTCGRMCLLERNWPQARQYFVTALRAPWLRLRAAAAIGWMFSWVHRDIEGMFRVAGRSALSNS